MEFITYETEGFVGILTINRPKALNALNSQVLGEIDEVLDAVDLEKYKSLNPHRSRRQIFRSRSRHRRDEYIDKGRGRSVR